MRRKILIAFAIIGIGMLNNGCQHQQPKAKEIYLNYLKNHIKKN